MKQFVILLKNKKRGKLTEQALTAHVEHLKELKSRELLVLCGPFTDNDGAIKIIKADSMEQAWLIANQDPFTQDLYYEDCDIFELIEAKEENNYLVTDKQTLANGKPC